MAMEDFPHVYPAQWGGVVFDRAGIGATYRTVQGAALWVAMTPDVFLSIATPLELPRPSLTWLRARIENGYGIAPSELRFDVRGRMPLALSHEGRHRMTALRERAPLKPVPVRLSFPDVGDHDLTDGFVEWVRAGAKSQRGRSEVKGPLFGQAEPDLGGTWPSGLPPGLHPGTYCKTVDRCPFREVSEVVGHAIGRRNDSKTLEFVDYRVEALELGGFEVDRFRIVSRLGISVVGAYPAAAVDRVLTADLINMEFIDEVYRPGYFLEAQADVVITVVILVTPWSSLHTG